MDTHSLEILVGLLLPILISFVKQRHFSQAVNGSIAVAVYAVVGVGALLASGELVSFQNLVVDIGIVTAAGTVAYTAFWKNIEDPSGGGPQPTPAVQP